jgi:ribose transport system substrate-binding protein
VKKLSGLLALTLAVVLVAASCGGGDDETTIGFANILRTGCEFCNDVENNVTTEVAAAGWELYALDHNLDANKMLANADAMITREVDVYLNFDGGITTYEATLEKMAEAEIPMIFIDGPIPEPADDVYWLGAHGQSAGQQMGEYAVNYVNENWGGQLDGIFGIFQSDWPDETKARMTVAMDVISQSFPEWTMDTITLNDVVLEGAETQAAAAAYLNANPDSTNLLFIATTNDLAGVAVVAAMEQLGRLDAGVVLSNGGASDALEEIRDEDSPFIMSIGYFPDKYGEFLRPIIAEILDGGTPNRVNHVTHQPIDASNIDELYPAG